MTNLHQTELLNELQIICRHIGKTTDVAKLRDYFFIANALWARIDRLKSEPVNAA
jgi:hypothetical protein